MKKVRVKKKKEFTGQKLRNSLWYIHNQREHLKGDFNTSVTFPCKNVYLLST